LIVALNKWRLSSDFDALTLEDFEGAVVVIPAVAIIVYIAIVRIVIHLPPIRVLLLCGIVIVSSAGEIASLAGLKVVPEGWVLVEGDGFELAVGIEAEDEGEEVVSEADD
jgi:hypothetical protein